MCALANPVVYSLCTCLSVFTFSIMFYHVLCLAFSIMFYVVHSFYVQCSLMQPLHMSQFRSMLCVDSETIKFDKFKVYSCSLLQITLVAFLNRKQKCNHEMEQSWQASGAPALLLQCLCHVWQEEQRLSS